MSTGITAHMVIKNEDLWVAFAINSVLPYVDQFLITDTGSSDDTVKIIQSIKSDKIVFNKVKVNSRQDLASVRNNQIKATTTPWIWIVDGDEVYPTIVAKEIIEAVSDPNHLSIVVRRFDLLGDIYHRQIESVGAYHMFGKTGHLVIRLLNIAKLGDVRVQGEYPLESYYSGNQCVNDLPSSKVYITKSALYHAMYLQRSSLGSNLSMFNRSKYKIETGIAIDGPVPELLSGLPKRSRAYEIIASILTPIKTIKRNFKTL